MTSCELVVTAFQLDVQPAVGSGLTRCKHDPLRMKGEVHCSVANDADALPPVRGAIEIEVRRQPDQWW